MEKVIAFDAANERFRVYFPKCETILASVLALPVRQFHKDWNDPYWIAGTDVATATALAQLAFSNSFIVDSVAADKIQLLSRVSLSATSRVAKLLACCRASKCAPRTTKQSSLC